MWTSQERNMDFRAVLTMKKAFFGKKRRLTCLDFDAKFDILLKTLKNYVLNHNI
jgi:hypothetical protein